MAVSRQIRLNEEIRKIAVKQVAAERGRQNQIQQAVESRFLERLTGVRAGLAERLNFVPPDGDVEAAMFRAIRNNIGNTINKSRASGFLVLPAEQAQKFRSRGGVPGEELDPFLFGGREGNQRPAFRLREDPLALLRKSPSTASSLVTGSGDIDGSDAGRSGPSGGRPGLSLGEPSAGTGDSSVAVSPEAIPSFVGRLIGTMTSPEETVAFGVKSRAPPQEIEGQISGFQLRSGPADVPAFYDFHSLQIAFDYVWQKAINEGIVDGVSELSRHVRQQLHQHFPVRRRDLRAFGPDSPMGQFAVSNRAQVATAQTAGHVHLARSEWGRRLTG